MLMSPIGLRPEKGCGWQCPAKTENYGHNFLSERAPHDNKSITYGSSNNLDKIGATGCRTPK
jgi:hypothetical protein